MLIRLLYEYSLFSDSLCIGIAKAVVDALSRKKDRNVQCEVRRVDCRTCALLHSQKRREN